MEIAKNKPENWAEYFRMYKALLRFFVAIIAEAYKGKLNNNQ